MSSYQEVPPPTASEIYKNVREISEYLVNSLTSTILERITSNMDMQDSIAFSTFYKEADVSIGSEYYHIFQSDHYRDKIFRRAEKDLYKRGYECKITLDTSGRYKKMEYRAKVLNPFKRLMRQIMPFVPVAMLYVSMFTYNHVITMRENDKI